MSASCDKKCGSIAQGHRDDHAVEHASRGHSSMAAAPGDARGGVEVGHRVELQQPEPEQQPTQIGFSLVAARPGQHLHDSKIPPPLRVSGRITRFWW
jgi:hypothetical protein